MCRGDFEITGDAEAILEEQPSSSPLPPRINLSTFFLPFVPILAGWCNDFALYHFFIDPAKVTEQSIPYLAYFDLTEKVCLWFMSACLLFKSAEQFAQEKNEDARGWLVIFFVVALVIEGILRMTGEFDWLGDESLHRAMAKTIHLSDDNWNRLPLLSFMIAVACWHSRNLFKSSKTKLHSG